MSRRRRASRNRRERTPVSARGRRVLDEEVEDSGSFFSASTQRLLIAAGIAAIVLFALPAAAYAYTGYFTRYLADDYCVAAHMETKGLWEAQVYWFTNWTGRFGSVFAMDFITFLGERAVPFSAGAIIGAWFLALVFACHQAGRVLFRRRLWLESLLVAALVLFCYLKLIPSRDDGLYWLSGGTNYTLPLVLWTLNIGLIARTLAAVRPNMLLATVGTVVLAFLSSGFAETFIVWQAAMMLISILLVRRFGSGEHRDRFMTLVPRALLGALVAANIVAFAPGNELRQGGTPPNTSVIETVLNSIVDSFVLIGEMAVRPETWLAAGIVLVITVAHHLRNPELRPLDRRGVVIRLGGALAVTYLLMLATFVPGYHFLASTPPDRALVTGVLTMVLTAMYLGHIGGRLLAVRLAGDESLTQRLPHYVPLAAAVGVLLVAVVALPPALSEAARLDEMSAYANAWDERDRMLDEVSDGSSQAQRIDVVVPLLLHGSGLEMRPTSTVWINRCASAYYGVKSIVAQPQ